MTTLTEHFTETGIVAADPIDTTFRAVFAELSPNTLRSYGDAFDDFARFLGYTARPAAARHLFMSSKDEAKLLVSRWRADLLARGFAAATVATKLGCLAGIVKEMQWFGVVPWALEYKPVKPTKLRDTRGPGADAVAAMLKHLDPDTAMNARDSAIIELLINPALRRGEVAGLDLCDVEFESGRIRIRGKGRHDDEFVTVAELQLDAIRRWLRFRGVENGPLFVNLDRAHETGKLTTQGIYNIVARTAAAVGVTTPTSPHRLRHHGITDAARVTGMNVIETAKFARHKNYATTERYIDNLKDVAGDVAKRVAAMRGK